MIPEGEKDRRRKISETLKKYYSTPEGKKSKIKASTGRKHSEETKKKLSLLRKKNNGMRGQSHSEQAKRKISKAMKGREITWGDKISKSKKGKVKISKKQKKQISETLKKHYSKHPGTFTGRRHTEEAKQKMRKANTGRYDGPNHPQWRGGIANFPYCFSWPGISKAIKERDNCVCQNPDCGTSEDLATHHIDYDKQNCEADNLITLCRSCNGKANFNRRHHQELYQDIVNKKFKNR